MEEFTAKVVTLENGSLLLVVTIHLDGKEKHWSEPLTGNWHSQVDKGVRQLKRLTKGVRPHGS